MFRCPMSRARSQYDVLHASLRTHIRQDDQNSRPGPSDILRLNTYHGMWRRPESAVDTSQMFSDLIQLHNPLVCGRAGRVVSIEPQSRTIIRIGTTSAYLLLRSVVCDGDTGGEKHPHDTIISDRLV